MPRGPGNKEAGIGSNSHVNGWLPRFGICGANLQYSIWSHFWSRIGVAKYQQSLDKVRSQKKSWAGPPRMKTLNFSICILWQVLICGISHSVHYSPLHMLRLMTSLHLKYSHLCRNRRCGIYISQTWISKMWTHDIIHPAKAEFLTHRDQIDDPTDSWEKGEAPRLHVV